MTDSHDGRGELGHHDAERLRWYLDKLHTLIFDGWIDHGSWWSLQTAFEVVEQERFGLTAEECQRSIKRKADERRERGERECLDLDPMGL